MNAPQPILTDEVDCLVVFVDPPQIQPAQAAHPAGSSVVLSDEVDQLVVFRETAQGATRPASVPTIPLPSLRDSTTTGER